MGTEGELYRLGQIYTDMQFLERDIEKTISLSTDKKLENFNSHWRLPTFTLVMLNFFVETWK